MVTANENNMLICNERLMDNVDFASITIARGYFYNER